MPQIQRTEDTSQPLSLFKVLLTKEWGYKLPSLKRCNNHTPHFTIIILFPGDVSDMRPELGIGASTQPPPIFIPPPPPETPPPDAAEDMKEVTEFTRVTTDGRSSLATACCLLLKQSHC